MMTTSARRTALESAETTSASWSPTTVLNRTSIPSVPSRCAMKRELLSVRPPIRSSEPIAMVSAVS